jgi:hypothetical protein
MMLERSFFKQLPHAEMQSPVLIVAEKTEYHPVLIGKMKRQSAYHL